MADFTVSGRFEEVSGEPMTVARAPQVFFRTVDSSVIDGAFVPSKEVAAELNPDGTFTVPLVGDAATRYKVTARWLAADADPEVAAYGYAEIPGEVKLFPGGDLATLIPPNGTANEEALVDMGAMLSSRGVITTVTDLNEMRTRAWAGDWAAREEFLLNTPDRGFEHNSLWLIKIRYGATNAVEQMLTSSNGDTTGVWIRNTWDNESWGPWRYINDRTHDVRGTLPDGTDLNALWHTGDAGGWHLSGASTYLNLPGTTTLASLLEVSAGNAENAVVQTWTVWATARPLEVWKRKLVNAFDAAGPLWGDWTRMARAGEGFVSHGFKTTLDADVMHDPEHVGTYGVRAHSLIGGPVSDIDNAGIFEVIWEANNVVRQMFTTTNHVWYRHAADGAGNWFAWHEIPRMEDISGSGSGLAQDDDGAWYVTEGAGSNPQPADRRMVDESRALDVFETVAVTSATVRRIIASTDPNAPLANGDLLLVYGA